MERDLGIIPHQFSSIKKATLDLKRMVSERWFQLRFSIDRSFVPPMTGEHTLAKPLVG